MIARDARRQLVLRQARPTRSAQTHPAGARVTVLADLAGTPFVFDLPDESEEARPEVGEARELKVSREVFSVVQRPAKKQFEDPARFEPVPMYEATFLLSASRRSARETAMVKLESLDVVAVPAPAPASGPKGGGAAKQSEKKGDRQK